MKSATVPLLRSISASVPIAIPPTQGERTIVRAKDVFSEIHQDFEVWKTNIPESPRHETRVGVFEISYDARFNEIFRSSKRAFDQISLTQEQIIAFALTHRSWLSGRLYGTFFLFKVQKDFLVSRVTITRDETLRISPQRLLDKWILSARDQHRIVLPL